MNGVIKVVNFI